MTKLPTFELFTDGACLGNPGPGGWAYILRDSSGKEVIGSGGDSNTTNQKMEVTAVLRALESLDEPSIVEIHADSQYVTKGLTEWMDGWIAKGWKNASKKPVANQDLWKPLAELRGKHTITTNWVRGHNGHPENERCDTIASAEAEKILQ
jgi:ribonuclease HI|tara:strand:+ start:565 stop:1014 length:450 start_codon:yes stop_codon:yes gene_type:complete